MKFLQSLFLAPLLLLSITAYADQIYVEIGTTPGPIQEILPQSCPTPKEEILGGVGNILTLAGAIVSNPHSRPNIAQCATGILANIINIALVAGKRAYKNRAELLSFMFDELHLDQEMRAIIEQKLEELEQKEFIQS
jgi:hypothetical protein